jgi:ABC-type antimicrobial peptide transport system permease subunit
VAERRFHLALLAIFSVLALILAAVGVYALVSYATRLRTGEIGVRMALGARAAEIELMIVGGALRLALPGIALGLAGSLALTRLLRGMLYGVSATDPVTLAQVCAGMLLVAAAAAFLPARRAARLHPARTLRADG